MLGYGPGRMLVRLGLTAIVAAIAWFTVGQSTLCPCVSQSLATNSINVNGDKAGMKNCLV